MTNLKNIIDYMHNHEDKLVVEDYLNDYAKKNHMYIDDCHRIAIRQIMDTYKNTFYFDHNDNCYRFGKELPSKIKVDLCDLDDSLKDVICEVISNYLFKKYGHHTNGYCCDTTIEVSNIDWDREER